MQMLGFQLTPFPHQNASWLTVLLFDLVFLQDHLKFWLAVTAVHFAELEHQEQVFLH